MSILFIALFIINAYLKYGIEMTQMRVYVFNIKQLIHNRDIYVFNSPHIPHKQTPGHESTTLLVSDNSEWRKEE